MKDAKDNFDFVQPQNTSVAAFALNDCVSLLDSSLREIFVVAVAVADIVVVVVVVMDTDFW